MRGQAGFLERHGDRIRIALLTMAVIMLALGWGMPLIVEHGQRWHFWRALAAAPVSLWGLLDAIWARSKRRKFDRQSEVLADVYEVLRELESIAMRKGVSLRLSECGVKVWRVGRRSLVDVLRRERRAPLLKMAVSPFQLPSHSSGLSWRIGMGVIGTALERNSTAAVDVAEAWAELADDSREQWLTLPEDRRFGLSYDEFRRLARPQESGPSGPFVLAVPYYRGKDPLGVAALDLAAADASALGLGGAFDDPDLRVTPLLYACVKRAFDP